MLKFLRVRVLKLEQKANNRVPGRNVSEVRKNRHSGFSGILAGANDFDDIAICGNHRDPVQCEARLDDFDSLLARNVFGDENVHLALDKIVHHQLFACELFVKMQHIDDVAIWKLEPHRPRRTGRGRRIRSRRGRCCESGKWLRPDRSNLR